ncbi:MAG: hypothetical protein ACM3WV_09140 [Bacillota bacterium]
MAVNKRIELLLAAVIIMPAIAAHAVTWTIDAPGGLNADKEKRWAERTPELPITVKNNLGSYLEGDRIEIWEPPPVYILQGHIKGFYVLEGKEYRIQADELKYEAGKNRITLEKTVISWDAPGGVIAVTAGKVFWFEKENMLSCHDGVKFQLAGAENYVLAAESIEAGLAQGTVKTDRHAVLRRETTAGQLQIDFPSGFSGNFISRDLAAESDPGRPISAASGRLILEGTRLKFTAAQHFEITDVTVKTMEGDVFTSGLLIGTVAPPAMTLTGRPELKGKGFYASCKEIYWDGLQDIAYLRGEPVIRKTGAQEVTWTAAVIAYHVKERKLYGSGSPKLSIHQGI